MSLDSAKINEFCLKSQQTKPDIITCNWKQALICRSLIMMTIVDAFSIFREQPLINTNTVSVDALGELPEGTFGKQYWKFLSKNVNSYCLYHTVYRCTHITV